MVQLYTNPIGSKNIADKYGARYVLVDPTILYDWKADKSIFDRNFDLLFSSGNYSLYKF